ncbi:N-acetyl-D-glucosamine kinase-like isoform X2 [Brevipalpus obovatus]|uniref:N-acetyl-D-glucosamine kinase-like isoform X2 n=1 Tax=Brevipalpus obovatus TaxID=246614 RepID=UPI003D9E1006
MATGDNVIPDKTYLHSDDDDRPANQRYFAGVEGGGSSSKVALIRGDGKIMSLIEDGLSSTNMLLVGQRECQEKIVNFIEQAKHSANLPKNLVLDGVGLCLSGCEDTTLNDQFKHSLIENYPHFSRFYTIESDTIGSIMTAAPTGTGSNSLLMNPDGKRFNCGGWGYMLGDEGSAFWIAHKVIKSIIDDVDGLRKSVEPIIRAKQIVFDYFQIKKCSEFIKHAYVDFEKSHVAGVCVLLAQEAEKGDLFLRKVFEMAGAELALHVKALLPHISQELLNFGPILIVCTGSVFKSWALIEKGFQSVLMDCNVPMVLVKLCKPAAIGAAYLAAKNMGHNLSIKFEENSEILASLKSVNAVSGSDVNQSSL